MSRSAENGCSGLRARRKPYRSFQYQAASCDRSRRVFATVLGEPLPCVGFIVTLDLGPIGRRDCSTWIENTRTSVPHA